MSEDLTQRAGLSPASRILITIAAAVVTIYGLSQSRDVIGPLAVAALVVMVAHPVRHPLERRGWPSGLATAVVIACSYLILVIMGGLLVLAVAQFVQLLPTYTSQIAEVKDEVLAAITALGFNQPSAEGAAGWLDPAKLVALATAVSSAVLGAGTAFFFVLAYIIFMAADAGGFGGLAQRFASTKASAIGVLSRYAQAVRRYLSVNTIFGAIVAVIDGVVLLIIGVPGVLLWVILAFVTNYIPNIGFVIALIPPTLIALLTGGWGQALAVVAAYCVINFTMQTLIQPKFVSDAVRLSLTLTFFSVIFWSTVLGPIGAILAIPATLFLRALLLEFDSGATWARWLTGDRVDDDEPVAVPPAATTKSKPARALHTRRR